MELELQLLGPFAAVYDGRPLDSFRSNKTQALLAYLVTEEAFANAEKDRPPAHRREHLMTLLWPRTPQKSAQVNLRQTLYQLRQAIPDVAGPNGGREPFLLSDRHAVQVNPDVDYRLDVTRFVRLLAGQPSPHELAEAVSLYRDPFLSDFHLPDSETFEEWAAARRATLQRMALEALEALTENHLGRAEAEEAERYARRQLEIGELRESGHRQLMRSLAQQGRRNAALAHFDEYRALLEQELGVKPSAEIEALYDALREGQAVVAAAPAARAEPQARQKFRLPSPATPFIGRREVAAVTAQLQENCRLLTLLGQGGSGKTRLGIEVARHLAGGYARGAAFVELAPLSDPADIPVAISMALDFRFSGGATPREQVLNYLANKEMLLVLDNFEHLLDGAELVGDLLETAPGVRLIATSRARLNLGPECLFEVGGLSLPEEGDDFEEAESVQLFMEHARRARPGFEVDEVQKAAVARICRLVEGMPLAIELAASWVRILPPQEIVRELAGDLDFLESERADLPERQRSMRAAFDYSWNMLDENEQAALTKLSVFRGGAGRQAATAVTGASLRTLLTLADHSLLTFDPDSGRFAVHELIRQFAEERLQEGGESEQVRDAHSAYYLQALAGRLPDLKGRDQLGALEAIEGDFENVRAAWKWAIRQRQWQHFPVASQSLYLFSFFRSRHLDGIELFEAARHAIPSPATASQRLARAYVLAGGAGLLSWLDHFQLQQDVLAASPDLEAAVEALTDPEALAYCQMMLGHVLIRHMVRPEYPADAITVLEAADAFYRRLEDSFYRALVLWRLGYAHAGAAHDELAIDLQRRALALARDAGDRFVASSLLGNMGVWTGHLRGPTEAVESYFREATKLAREIGNRPQYAHSLWPLAAIFLWRDGDLEKSRPMLEEAVDVAAEQNSLRIRTATLNALSTHRLVEGQYEKVLALTAETLSLAPKNGQAWCWATLLRGVAFLGLGDSGAALPHMKRGLSSLNVNMPGTADWVRAFLPYYGVLLGRQGKHERAAELLALGLTSHHRGGLAIDPLLKRTRAELEEVLGEERFAAAWERGKNLDPLTAAEEVLAALAED